jgi:hypothetical protein
MLTLLAALAMTPVATAATDSHLPAAPWWERITVTVSGDGQSQGCLYTSSSGANSSDCTVEDAASMSSSSSSSSEHSATGGASLTRITYERRFTPGMVTKADVNVQTGDTLLSREVMALAIDGRGSVKNCKVVAASGQMTVDYGCADAQAEKFQASVTRGAPPAAERQGYMTVLVYAHQEHLA